MSGIVTFGEFELDQPRFELRIRGQPVDVQPKVLRLLILLVTERHRCVADDELLAAVWPRETVSRASIKRAVMGARTALRDRGQGCIRTVRGHGYQFVMPVETDAARGPASSTKNATVSVPLLASTTSEPSFVGREPELAEIDTQLHAALAGRGGALLLIGEPGIGKTCTLRELTRRAEALGARAVLGRCMELDGAPAFWPVLQILRELLQGRNTRELHALLGPGAPDIAEAFPELRQWLPDLPAAAAIGSVPGRFRFFDSMASFLGRVAQQQPLVLLFDDLQRADQPTLRLLLFLVRQLDRSRVLVVGAARKGSHRDAGVTELLAELARQDTTRSIELHGFAHGEIAHYLQARTGHKAPAEIIERLHEQTAGNPLFLEELLRGLRTAHDGSAREPWERLARAGLSTEHAHEHTYGLRGAIERHLQMLSEPCQTLLTSAAVLGREFSVVSLTQLVERPAQEVHAALSAATDLGVLQSVPGGVGQQRFTHMLIRDVLYERMPLLQRAQAHAHAGLALEARGAAWDQALLAEMAEHFMHAAPTHDGGRALLYARRAAQSAMQRFAYEEAAEHFRRALQLIELGEPDAAQRMELLLARGEALAFGSEVDAARATLRQAVALARALGATDVLVRAATLMARPRESGLAHPEQIELLREAHAVLPRTDPRTPGLQALLAKSLSYSSDNDARPALALGALALTRKLHDPVLRADALQACHEALTEPEYIAERVSIADELAQLAHQLGDPCLLLHASTARAQNAVERGDMVGVDAAIQTLDALAEQVREPLFRWYVRIFRGMRCAVAGRLDLAEQFAREAQPLGAVVGQGHAYHGYCIQMAVVYRLQGRIAEAEAMVRDISSRHPALAGWRSVLASIEAELGRTELAREELALLMADNLAAPRRDPYLLSALCPLAELCVRVGDEAQARVVYEALLPYEHHHGNVSFGGATHGPISIPLGWLAMRMGDFTAAARHCEQGIAAAEAMPSPVFCASARLALTYVLMLTQTPDAQQRARTLLRLNWKLAEASGLWSITMHCRELAKALGIEEQPQASVAN